ncbi:hypothetical protein L211DRAFT_791309, partial [Terfezia boudieri ATCC MYA-4762]
LIWPGNSPDLNIIEICWAYLKHITMKKVNFPISNNLIPRRPQYPNPLNTSIPQTPQSPKYPNLPNTPIPRIPQSPRHLNPPNTPIPRIL